MSSFLEGHNMEEIQDLSIPLRIELGDALGSLSATPAARAFVKSLSLELEVLIQHLGLHGSPHVRIRKTHSQRAVSLRVHGSLVRYSADLMKRTWIAVAPADLRDLPAAEMTPPVDHFPDQWLSVIVKELDLAKEPDRNRQVVFDFLQRLVLEIIQDQPSCLVGPMQVAACWKHGHTGSPRVDAPDMSMQLGVVLRELLDLWVTLGDSSHLCQIVQDICEQGCPPEDAVERLFAHQHAARIEIHIHPAYLAELIPETRIPAPVSVYSSALPVYVREMFELFTDGSYYELGLRMPDIFLVPSLRVPAQAIQVKINARLLPPLAGMKLGELLVNATMGYLDEKKIEGRVAYKPFNNEQIAFVDLALKAEMEAQGVITWTAFQYLPLLLLAEISRFATRLLSLDEVEYEIARLDGDFPDLVKPVLARYTLEHITRVLRGMLSEGISIQNMPATLERLLLYNTISVADGNMMILDDRLPLPYWMPADKLDSWEHGMEFVRLGMSRHLAEKYKQGYYSLSAYTLSAQVEKRLNELDKKFWLTGSELSKPDENWVEALCEAIWSIREGNLDADYRRAPIVTKPWLRYTLHRLLAAEFPLLPVITHQEMPPLLEVVSLATLSTR